MKQEPMCDAAALNALVAEVANVDDATAVQRIDGAVAQWPRDPRLYFLRGSVQAQRRDYAAAANDFGAAIALDPDYTIARFQLGLLHLTSGRFDQARDVWAPLDRLPEPHALRLFKQGMAALVEDRFADCERLLRAGIEANAEFPPLNGDMQKVLERLRQATAEGAADAGEARHVLLSGYGGSTLKH